MRNGQQSYSSIFGSLEDVSLHVNADGAGTLVQQSVARAERRRRRRREKGYSSQGRCCRTGFNWYREGLPVVEHASHPHPLLLSSRQNVLPVADRVPA